MEHLYYLIIESMHALTGSLHQGLVKLKSKCWWELEVSVGA